MERALFIKEAYIYVQNNLSGVTLTFVPQIELEEMANGVMNQVC